MLKHLVLITILIMWTGTYLLLRNHLPDRTKTISKHASKNTRYHVTYGLLEILVVGLFSIFIFGWFMPTFKLGPIYGFAAVGGLVGTFIAAFIAAFIPDRDGWQGNFHGIGAYAMAISLLLMNVILLNSPRIHFLTRVALYAGLAYMSLGTLIAIVNTSFYRKSALKFQIPLLLAVYF